MKTTPILLSVAALLALAGCPGPEAAKKPDGATPESPAAKEAPKEVAQNLKHAAYDWMGFGRLEPFTFAISSLDGEAPTEGTQTLQLLSADDKAAKFQITRDGAMARLGNEEFEVRPDGIYQTSMPKHTLSAPVMVMPADIAEGKVWSSKFSAASETGQQVAFTLNNKAVRTEKVKTKAGEFDGLLIVSTGDMTVTTAGKAEKNSLSSKSWYSKGLGNVKMTLEVKMSNGNNSKSTVELVKAGGTSEPASKP